MNKYICCVVYNKDDNRCLGNIATNDLTDVMGVVRKINKADGEYVVIANGYLDENNEVVNSDWGALWCVRISDNCKWYAQTKPCLVYKGEMMGTAVVGDNNDLLYKVLCS